MSARIAVDDIAGKLRERHAQLDPLTASFKQLRQWLGQELGEQAARACDADTLEAIQRAWHDRVRADPGRG